MTGYDASMHVRSLKLWPDTGRRSQARVSFANEPNWFLTPVPTSKQRSSSICLAKSTAFAFKTSNQAGPASQPSVVAGDRFDPLRNVQAGQCKEERHVAVGLCRDALRGVD